MLTWFSDGRRLLAAAIIFAAVVGAWMFRYDRMGAQLQAPKPIYRHGMQLYPVRFDNRMHINLDKLVAQCDPRRWASGAGPFMFKLRATCAPSIHQP